MMIDLSVRLDSRTPAYPGNPQIDIRQTEYFETKGYEGHAVTLGTHTGTHIDAPAHMVPGGVKLGDIPLETFVGRGKLVETDGGQFSLAALQNAGIAEGDIVLFHTGMDEQYYEPAYFSDYPVMGQEIADYLVRAKVKMVGVDTCSIDNAPDFPVHRTLLGNGILIIENLTNLGALAGRECIVYALPLKLDLDAAPARIIAEVKQNE